MIELPEVALVAELIPYRPPYLGVHPARETEAFVVRHVMPGSPGGGRRRPCPAT